jgi:hypothetical protein
LVIVGVETAGVACKIITTDPDIGQRDALD